MASFLQLTHQGQPVACTRASSSLGQLQQAPKMLSRVYAFDTHRAAKAHLHYVGKLIDACWHLMDCMRDLRIRMGSVTQWWLVDGGRILKTQQDCLKYMMRVRCVTTVSKE